MYPIEKQESDILRHFSEYIKGESSIEIVNTLEQMLTMAHEKILSRAKDYDEQLHKEKDVLTFFEKIRGN